MTAVGTKRAVLYWRVSTGEQAGERHVSLQTQQAHTEAFCQRHGLAQVAEPFIDTASGRKDHRANYQRMVRLCLDRGR